MLAEMGKNDKYVGHFPDLWFSGVNHSELVREEQLQRGQRREKNSKSAKEEEQGRRTEL